MSRLWFSSSHDDVRDALYRTLSTEEIMLLKCGVGEES